jgi:hypothetical protein
MTESSDEGSHRRMTQREVARYAKFRAASLLEAVLNGWDPEDLVERVGQENVDRISEEITSLALRLSASGWSLSEIEEARVRRS